MMELTATGSPPLADTCTAASKVDQELNSTLAVFIEIAYQQLLVTMLPTVVVVVVVVVVVLLSPDWVGHQHQRGSQSHPPRQSSRRLSPCSRPP